MHVHHPIRRLATRFAVLAALLLAAPLAFAQDAAAEAAEAPAATVTDTWVLWPKAGQRAEFEKGTRDFLAWRKSQGDPARWDAYEPYIGDDLGYVVFRSQPMTWAELDALRAWSDRNQVGRRYAADIAAHAERVEHYLDVFQPEMSYWETDAEFDLFVVTEADLKFGHAEAVTFAFAQFRQAAMDARWKRAWAVERSIGGGNPLVFVRPLNALSELDEPSTPFRDVLLKSIGSEQGVREAYEAVAKGLGTERTTVYLRRKDLSTPAK